ncbi:endonuclease/exonuclease/phosphatase family protein [Salinibacter grassmerensis]|uniref:endonuclease/exonuclease/phosphatase family protein n=1 Tax=Salinibacter grassmerensis TaxID=3040353 RepID=UPI0021E75044|nr:endonuclease/exonuclease/phosphatase family protein [Salinibacter grassmerensis]
MKFQSRCAFRFPSASACPIRIVVLTILLAFFFGGCDSTGTNDVSDGNDSGNEIPDPVKGFASQAAPIVVDGKGRDWSDLTARYDDTDDGNGAIGIQKLWVAHTDQHLFLRLMFNRQIDLLEKNNLTLHLDTDNNPNTGASSLGLGAELEWTFGQRIGRLRGQEISHDDIGISSLPTVRSNTFEIALDRSAESVFSGDSLRVGLSTDGDRLPDEDGGLGYVLSDTDAAANAPSLDGPPASGVRVLSYNVLGGSIFKSDVQPNYRRILDAIDPDILGLQEVPQSASQTEQVAENELGIPAAWDWAKTDTNTDLVLGSSHPIQDTHVIPGTESTTSGAFLLDMGDAFGGELIVVLMHPPCCNEEGGPDELSRDEKRQLVVDGVAAFLRDVKQGDGPFGVQSETPIAVIGDMNFVGDPQQPRTLRSGEIVNTDRFGPSVSPDWDSSPLLDTNPQQVAAPFHTTWTRSESSFSPGRLDYIYVTDSVLDAVHEFVLNTRRLSDARLSENGLQHDDTVMASDHLPLVVDLTLR